MKKEIMPRGYDLNYADFIWIVMIYIILFLFFLSSGIADNAENIKIFMKFVENISCLIVIILGMRVFRFYKSYKRRKQRNQCIKNALYAVEGIPLQIEEECIDYKGRKSYEIPNIGVHLCYRIMVAYKDPITGNYEKVESELYSKNPTRFLEHAEIVVYIRKNPIPLVVLYKK